MAQVHLANFVVAGLIATFFFAPGFVTEAEAFGPDCATGGEPAQCVPTITIEPGQGILPVQLATTDPVIACVFTATIRVNVAPYPTNPAVLFSSNFGGECESDPCHTYDGGTISGLFDCTPNQVFGVEPVHVEGAVLVNLFCVRHARLQVDLDNDGDLDMDDPIVAVTPGGC